MGAGPTTVVLPRIRFLHLVFSAGGFRSQAIELPPDAGETLELDVNLMPEPVIRGRVVNPLPGAETRVSAYIVQTYDRWRYNSNLADLSMVSYTYRTSRGRAYVQYQQVAAVAADGTFEFGLPVDGELWLVASSEGTCPARVGLGWTAGSREDVEMTLLRPSFDAPVRLLRAAGETIEDAASIALVDITDEGLQTPVTVLLGPRGLLPGNYLELRRWYWLVLDLRDSSGSGEVLNGFLEWDGREEIVFDELHTNLTEFKRSRR